MREGKRVSLRRGGFLKKGRWVLRCTIPRLRIYTVSGIFPPGISKTVEDGEG